jgi:peptide/nickel transport system substrate-binding protein
MGSEPDSLFLYGDSSVAARSVRQAIYDGPVDVLGYALSPVILQKIPSVADGDIVVEQVQVPPSSLIVDSSGNIASLAEGTSYLPSGCTDSTCAQVYSGQEPASMDQVVAVFRLLPGLLWSDGSPLTADDSLYSFEVAQSIYPRARPELVSRTASYTTRDELTVEWRGLPGWIDGRAALNFFSPLPRHAWDTLPADQLFTSEITSRMPIGWGPYQLSEWSQGDHISLQANPNYFRTGEDRPAFTDLVFRFVDSRQAAVEALLAGECDYIDETVGLEVERETVLGLEEDRRLSAFVEVGSAWESLVFGIQPLEPSILPIFQAKEMRQAIAQCIDRERILNEITRGLAAVPNSYAPPAHPLANPDARSYAFDPEAASQALETAGWQDTDGDPSTPRVAQGVPNVAAGTPLSLTFLTTDEEEKQRTAAIIQESLAQCGVEVNTTSLPWEQLFASGPEGPVFGRKFSLSQVGWITTLEPSCSLYLSSEIPGPFPEYPRGWGGANAGGYNNPDFDQACRRALFSFPGTAENQQSHWTAQAIFAEDLPALPLYVRLKMVASRTDMCGVEIDPSADSALWNLESFDYGEGCEEIN